MKRNPALDALRGIAVLAVLFYHGLYLGIDRSRYPVPVATFLKGMGFGRMGVNLFFVLSGFLITGILWDSRERSDFYRRFYWRRILRILPAYFVIVVVLALTRTASPAYLGLSLAYLANLTPFFGVAIAYPVLWSLAVEEHFYLLWPTAVRKISRRALLWLCAIIIAVSPLLRLFSLWPGYLHGHINHEIFNYTWNSFDGLACGSALALLAVQLEPPSLRRLCYWLLGAATLIWVVGLPFGILTRDRPLGGSLQVVPCNLLFTSIVGFSIGGLRWLGRIRILRFFGDISYGLYLVHVWTFWEYDRFIGPRSSLVLRFLIAGTVAILLAWASRRTLEDYFLRMKEPRSR